MTEFTCPRCGRTSHNPADAAEGYCGACHGFTGHPELTSHCTTCLMPLPGAKDPLHPEAKAAAGDVSLCLYCGAVAIFTGEGHQLREPTDDELLEVLKDPEVQRYRQARAEVRGGRLGRS